MTAANGSRLLATHLGWPTTTPAFLNHTVDANNDGVGFVFTSLSADPITHVGIRWGARAGTPNNITVGLQSVGTTTGVPSGTFLQNAGNDCKATITPPADTTWDGVFKWFALDYAYTPTVSPTPEYLAIVALGTVTDAGNYSTITTNLDNMPPTRINFPYSVRLTGGSWSSSVGSVDPPIFGWRTASGRYGRIIQSIYGTRSASTVGHRVAMKATIPSGWCDTYKVRGIRFNGSLSSSATKNPFCRIWSASTVLATITLDTEQQAASAGSVYMTSEYTFDTAPTLTAGTAYYFGLEVADAASAGVIIYGSEVAEAEDLANQDGGNICCLSTYDGSAWTDNTLVRPWMELILEDITEPSGGGGGIIMPARSRVFSPMGSY